MKSPTVFIGNTDSNHGSLIAWFSLQNIPFLAFWFPGFFCPDILKHPLPCALLQGSTTPCRGRVSAHVLVGTVLTAVQVLPEGEHHPKQSSSPEYKHPEEDCSICKLCS